MGLSAGGGAALRRVLNRAGAGVIRDGERSAAGSACGLSFSADTTVATPDGPRTIASIKPGDKVLAYDPGTKAVTAQTVAQTFLNHDGDRVDVTLETPAETNGAAANSATKTQRLETIHTTSNHPW